MFIVPFIWSWLSVTSRIRLLVGHISSFKYLWSTRTNLSSCIGEREDAMTTVANWTSLGASKRSVVFIYLLSVVAVDLGYFLQITFHSTQDEGQRRAVSNRFYRPVLISQHSGWRGGTFRVAFKKVNESRHLLHFVDLFVVTISILVDFWYTLKWPLISQLLHTSLAAGQSLLLINPPGGMSSSNPHKDSYSAGLLKCTALYL